MNPLILVIDHESIIVMKNSEIARKANITLVASLVPTLCESVVKRHAARGHKTNAIHYFV